MDPFLILQPIATCSSEVKSPEVKYMSRMSHSTLGSDKKHVFDSQQLPATKQSEYVLIWIVFIVKEEKIHLAHSCVESQMQISHDQSPVVKQFAIDLLEEVAIQQHPSNDLLWACS